MPTSESTEYLPPTLDLCSIKNKFNFLAIKNKLLFFSEITITFFEFFLIRLSKNALDKVSIVFPDLEIIMKRVFDKFSFFLKFIILF